jgi:hypothetical protein
MYLTVYYLCRLQMPRFSSCPSPATNMYAHLFPSLPRNIESGGGEGWGPLFAPYGTRSMAQHRLSTWSFPYHNVDSVCFYCFYVPICRHFETGGSLSRRVKCRRVPQPRWVDARPSAKGGERGARRWAREREVEIPRPSCSSRAQVGCACSRGLQASTRGKERAALCERPSRPRPRAANPL